MSAIALTESNHGSESFDLFRLTKAKEAVDVCANTLREYHGRGLPFYRQGRAVFISRSELAMFIRNPAAFAANKSKRRG